MIKIISRISFATLFLFSVFASAQNYCGGTVKGGDGKPWPWRLATQVPLKSMQGVWQTVTGDCKNQFVFRLVDTASGTKIVRIMQYDPYACRIVGAGSGWLNDKIVIAQMNQKGVPYNMTIHAFNESDVEETQYYSHVSEMFAPGAKYVFVISLYPVGRWEDKTTYQIVKVDSTTNLVCQ